MKIRVKFAKEGAMKFIGHLDIMRYFQRAIRRAGIDVAYSEGFSPHMIMSFANPLGVGLTSEGEYFDLMLKSDACTSQELIDKLNAVMVEGMRVLNVVQVPEEKASKAMSLVEAADYIVRFREPEILGTDWKDKFTTFMKQTSIIVIKKTKKAKKRWISVRLFTDGILKKMAFLCRYLPEAVTTFVRSWSSKRLPEPMSCRSMNFPC